MEKRGSFRGTKKVKIKFEIAAAIRTLRAQIRWKPGKGVRHLEKRKHRGHLPPESTLRGYENLITAILSDDQSLVYHYDVRDTTYGAVRGIYEEQEWIVIFGLDGVMETAFPPRRPERYIAQCAFTLLGKIEEILK